MRGKKPCSLQPLATLPPTRPAPPSPHRDFGPRANFQREPGSAGEEAILPRQGRNKEKIIPIIPGPTALLPKHFTSRQGEGSPPEQSGQDPRPGALSATGRWRLQAPHPASPQVSVGHILPEGGLRAPLLLAPLAGTWPPSRGPCWTVPAAAALPSSPQSAEAAYGKGPSRRHASRAGAARSEPGSNAAWF